MKTTGLIEVKTGKIDDAIAVTKDTEVQLLDHSSHIGKVVHLLFNSLFLDSGTADAGCSTPYIKYTSRCGLDPL